MKRQFEIVLFSSLGKLKEHESKQKNILFHYPENLPTASVEKLYESLTMCVYLFADTLENPPRIIRLGNRRSCLSIHCRILNGNYLFAYGRSQSGGENSLDLTERASVLYDLLVFELGCLACISDRSRVVKRISTILTGLDETASPMFQSAIPRLSHMEPIIGQKAFNLLRVCQRQQSVVGGCIFYKHELLADHFPNNLTHVLAVLQQTNKSFGTRTILPENAVSEHLQNVRLRQGVSLCSCFVSRDMFPKKRTEFASKSSSPSPQLCHCSSKVLALSEETSIPRLCCLASLKLSPTQKRTSRSETAHKKDSESEKVCAIPHSKLECMVTYVEAHSDIFLCLLLREEEMGEAQTLFDSLYKLCFVLLRDLELCILRARDRDHERNGNSIKESGMKQKAQYHAFTNSYRLHAEDRKMVNQHRTFLDRVHQAFQMDDDLEGVELSDYMSSSRRGWKEIAYVYEE